MPTDTERLDYIETDMYRGRGLENPSVTARLSRLEDCVQRLEAGATERRNLLYAILAIVCGDLVIRLLGIK